MVWAPDGQSRDGLIVLLLTEAAPALQEAAAGDLSLDLQDEYVAAGARWRQAGHAPQVDAIGHCSLPSARDRARRGCDAARRGSAGRFEAFLVSQSTVLANKAHPPGRRARTEGFAEIAILTRPDRLTWNERRSLWQERRTEVAVETHSTFEHMQNLVVRPLTENAPPAAAIVEERFAPGALTEPRGLFQLGRRPVEIGAERESDDGKLRLAYRSGNDRRRCNPPNPARG